MVTWACTGSSNYYLGLAAAIFAVLGLVFIVLWAWFCGGGVNHAGCATLRTIIDWLTTFEGIQAIVVALMYALGSPCGVGALLSFGYIGLVIAVLWKLGRWFGCF